MSSPDNSSVTDTAREYYNSTDADHFYYRIWGGEDIHIGMYEAGDSIFDASRRTVETIAGHIKTKITANTRILDAGAGYGGAARFLAKTYGCHVTALNLSEVQNERNRQMNKEQKLDHLITVIDGSFEDLPFEEEVFDIVWSEDSFLHSGEKDKIFKEINRVLKPGGELIFTDPMQADHATSDDLAPVLKRIHLSQMGSFTLYRKLAEENGFQEIGITDLSAHLPRHYGNVAEELKKRAEQVKDISQQYIDNMLTGLSHWVNAGEKGLLNWGILHFRKE